MVGFVMIGIGGENGNVTVTFHLSTTSFRFPSKNGVGNTEKKCENVKKLTQSVFVSSHVRWTGRNIIFKGGLM